MKRRAISIFLLTLAFLGLNPLSANAAETTTVQLDLSENTLQFGGFPGVRDEEEILNGIYVDEITDDACMTVSDKEDALESIRALVDRSIDTQADTIDVSEYGLSEDAAVEIISDVLNANPSYFFVEGASAVMTEEGTVDSIELAYAETADEMRVEYDDAIYSILAQVDPDWNDEETIFFLHDYLVTHCQYDQESYGAGTTEINASTAYGALVLHKAVCSGYACAFTELGNRSGIKTSYVSSQAMNHAWNIVELNGDHFYVDCTWDDPVDFHDTHCDHRNLLLSQDGMISTDHHTPGDWVLDYNGEKIDGVYQNKKYDEAEWHNSYKYSSPFVCIDDGVLITDHYTLRHDSNSYLPDETIIERITGIFKYNCNLGKIEQILDMKTDLHSILVRIGDSYFISINDSIYLLNIKTGDKKEVYKLSESERGSGAIYAMEADENRIKYKVATGIRECDVTSSGVVDVSAYTTSIFLDKKVVTFEGLNGSDTIRAITNSDTPVKWESSDTKVATITQGGQITPVGYGSTIIKASVGNIKAFCRVNVDTTWQNDYVYTGVYTFPGNTWREQYRYITKGVSGLSISGYKGTDDKILIPASATINGETYPVNNVSIHNNKVKSIAFASPIKLEMLSLANCENLEEVSLNNVDTSSMKSMYSMFSGCSSLKKIDISGLDTSSVTSMDSMFSGCSSLKKIDISDLDTSSVTSMDSMFYGCSSLEKIDMSGLDTSSVTSMYSMFSGCSSLEKIDISGLDTSGVTSMYSMFSGCSSLKKIDVSGFDTSCVTATCYMFKDCESLQTLDLSYFELSNVTAGQDMFENCINLEELDTPKNVKEKIDLPCPHGKDWEYEDSEGNRYRDLPENLSFSLHLKRVINLQYITILDEETSSSYEINMSLGSERKLIPQFDPENAADKRVTWKSSDESYVSVSNEGTIKALKYTNDPIIISAVSVANNKIKGSIRVRVLSENNDVLVESISVYAEGKTGARNIDMTLGAEQKLITKIYPEDASDKRVIWKSSDPSYVSVSDDGTIKALKGTRNYITITATSVSNEKISGSIQVRVLSEDAFLVQIVPWYPNELIVGQTKQLEYETIPETVEIKSESWKSSDISIATVDDTGAVTGIKEGTVDITLKITTNDSSDIATCTSTRIRLQVVDKNIPLESFELESDSIELNTGEKKTIIITKKPVDATDKLTFTSADPTVASVNDNGRVTALESGETDITVSGAGMQKKCHVTVYRRLTDISVDVQEKKLFVGDIFDINARIKPADVKASVSWNADDGGRLIKLTPSDDGMSASVSALSAGRVCVTVTATDVTREPAISKEASTIITIMDKGAVELEKWFVISGLQSEYRFASSPVCPDILVYYDGVRLLERREYTVSYSNNKRPGTGYLTITGKGNYSGRSKQIAFNIIRAETGDTSIKKALVTNVEKSYPFTGEPVAVPGLKVDLNGTELKEGEDYIVSYRNHIDTGTASIVIEGIGNYKDAITKKFKITPADITTARIEDISTFYKPGGAKPIPVIMYGEYMLKYGVDYKVSWAKNTAAGNGTMTVSGKGNFTGRTTAAFSIRKSDLADTTIAVTDAKYKKNAKGSSYMGKFKVYDTDGKCLKAGRDYILAYENVTKNSTIDKETGKDEVNEGDVIRVTAYPGSGDNYTGTVSAEYKVTGSVKPISKAPLIKIPAQQYTGAEIKPQISFTGLDENKDYEVLWYCNNVQKGTAKALVRGLGDYSGCRLVSFKIVARKLTN